MEVQEQEINPFQRTIGEVEAVLEFAKVDRSEIKPFTQSINFSQNLDNDYVKLLEVDSSIAEALTTGEKVVIRGDKDDFAVLCTKSRTFEIKQGEVSNAMLLLPEMDFGSEISTDVEMTLKHRQVNSVTHIFYELRPIKPRLMKLRHLLEENQYSGPQSEEDEDHQGKKYTTEDLYNLVQASEEEIIQALNKIQAILFQGFWRVLDFDYLAQLGGHIVQLCEENGWIDSGVPMEECLSVLQDLFPREIVQHVLKNYSDKMVANGAEKDHEDDEEKPMQIDIEYYRLNEDKICRLFAEQILRTARKFNYSQFLSTWEKTVPMGMKTSLYQLEGLALIDRNSSPEVISYFPKENLPEDISERFNQLFSTEEKWSLEDITPYIRDLQTDKMDVKAMLTKFARSSVSNGVRVYNSRKLLQ